MPARATVHSLLQGTTRLFRASWRSLFWTDVLFKIIAFIFLTPLMGILFRALIATSGNAVISDVDILYYFLRPMGWGCAILVGAIWLGIVALEQAALMGVLCAESVGRKCGPLDALRFAAANAWPVIRVTGHIVVLTLLATVPFVAVAAVVYFTLLTKHDINYYLHDKPPVFGVAVGLGSLIAAALVALLMRLITGWLFAIPLVLFENVRPREALRTSVARAHGHRRTLLCWIVGWALVMVIVSGLATGLVGLAGRLLMPESTDSLRRLAVTIGMTLLLWAVVNVAVNVLSTTTFASILFNLYREIGRHGVTNALQADFAAVPEDATRLRIRRKHLLVAGIVGVVLASAIGAAALYSVRLKDDVKIMAHRGSSHAAPENSMAAFAQAIQDGADWIELDVQETADGQVVVSHDSDFMKVANQGLKIWDATMDDLKIIDIGSRFASEFKDERVPTLDEVLTACQGKIRVDIELKYYGHNQQLEQRVADIVDAHGMASDVMAMSLKMDVVQKMKSVRPDWKVGLLMSVSAGKLNKMEADFVAINARFATRRLIREAHRSGKEVYAWTVDDAPTMSTLISRGVDGLLTNRPALARSVLEQRAQMSAPERLLLELAGLLGSVPSIDDDVEANDNASHTR